MKEKKWSVYLIHHSHTDIGYTQRQDKIIRYHCDFIRQAMDILDRRNACDGNRENPFIWQCENYWQVENFYEAAGEEEKNKFEHYVSTGEIGLSGNYLNMTELVSMDVLEASLERMKKYGERIGHNITAGMTADINGMAWGYADALYQSGVRSLYSCLHPHHGMFPLYRKMLPFYWRSPLGNKILVWNGDHYHLGNELFLSPHGGTNYTIHDEYSKPMREHMILNTGAQETADKELEIATVRIKRYLENLEKEGYPGSIVPVMVSGAITDNAPPGENIPARIAALNEHFNGSVTFSMSNLENFFEQVEKDWEDIPVYEGDWTDWWADGVGSTPAEVKVYRDAVRKYGLCRKMDTDEKLGSRELMIQAQKDLMLYAEHTWGYSSSVSQPWESFVSLLEMKKSSYALAAHAGVSRNLDGILEKRGEVSIRQDKPQVYSIFNPHNVDLRTTAQLYVEFWEYVEGCRFDASMPLQVVCCESGEILPSQVKTIARAIQVETELFIPAGSRRKVMLRLAKCESPTVKNHAHIGAEGVCDLLQREGNRTDIEEIQTDHFLLRINDREGVCSLVSSADGEELMRADTCLGAFAGAYEITQMKDGACETRRRMGRARRSDETVLSAARLRGRKIIEQGEVYVTLRLDYELEGTQMYAVLLKVFRHLPRLEVMVQLHKDSRLEPENLYVALPFTAGEESELWIDKTGCIMRPGLDQLPGSCQDFYLIQNGVLWKKGGKNVMVITKDAPLITLGSLKPQPVSLCSGGDRKQNQAPVWSWVMNNYWETNFKVNLGGFYEFCYIMGLDYERSSEEGFAYMEAENQGLVVCYSEREGEEAR